MKHSLVFWLFLFTAHAWAQTPFRSLEKICRNRPALEIELKSASLEKFWPGFRANWQNKEVAVFELDELSQVFVAVFPTAEAMNAVLGRPTVYLTEGKKIVSHREAEKAEVFSGYVGHDLQEKLLRSFARDFSKAEKKMAPPRSFSPDLCREASFWKDFLWPKILKPGELILIAAAMDASPKSTLEHEILHALFYRTSKIRRLTEEFWETQVKEADRKAIIKNLAEYRYDVPANRELLLNEFFAYLLQTGAEQDILGRFAKKYRALLQRHFVENGMILPEL